MKPTDLFVPTVPVSYVLLMLELATERGVRTEQLLHGLNISPALLQNPDGRIALLTDYAELCRRCMALTGEPAMAYEFGLRSTLTTHGIVGYGLMSQPSLRHVLDFANRFGAVLRMPAWDLAFFVEGEYAYMRGTETVSHSDLRSFSTQQLIISCYTIMAHLFHDCSQNIELYFDYPEPDFHKRYLRLLPKCHFNTPYNQIQIPLQYLDIPLKTADMISAKLAERECERELALIGHGQHQDVVRHVRALLNITVDGYLSLEQIADKQCVSARTLARQLQERGTSYRQLLHEAQRRDSHTLLRDPRMSVADVAMRLGYSSVANFARAFRVWHDMSPGEFRDGVHGHEANMSGPVNVSARPGP
jgi:AraC-like DNA-binding protein